MAEPTGGSTIRAGLARGSSQLRGTLPVRRSLARLELKFLVGQQSVERREANRYAAALIGNQFNKDGAVPRRKDGV